MKEKIKKFIPEFILDGYHLYLSFLGAIFYGFPSNKIKVIGVTGTNGKSTTVDLITRVLEEAGYRVASLSSIKFKIGDKEWPNDLKMTMPGRFKIKKFLKQAVKAKCQYAVLEVASEGIKQHRHRFIDFKVAVFTNLTPEHIEAHKGFENYKKAKGEFFRSVKGVHIVNADDQHAGYFLSFPSEKKYLYGIKTGQGKEGESVRAEGAHVSKEGVRFTVRNADFNLKLLGEFNIYNALAAISVGLSQGISIDIAKRALERADVVPGRMEEIISSPFRVFIDYAFTPNALEQVYQTVRKGFNPSKMICVLGSCGGGRDKWKRPVLGGIAGKYCDQVIVTNEDPYDEDPLEIMEQVAAGAQGKAEKIPDRREAISRALKSAQPGSAVVITGKGCEPWICLANGKKIPWNEKETVREELKKMKG